MSLGLPAHIAPQAVRRSFIRAEHTIAVTLLVIALLSILIFQSARLADTLWLAAIALVPALILLHLRHVDRSVLWALGYLIIAGLGAYFYAITVLSQANPIVAGDGFSFLPVKVALIMVGGSGISLGAGLMWTTAGYLVAEAAIGIALLQAGHPLHFDIASLSVFVVTLSILPLSTFISRRQILAGPRIHRAVADERLAAVRYRIEVRAAALMHDTILSHLAVLAEVPDGTMAPELRDRIRKDVESLVGEEWLAESSMSVSAENRRDWQSSGLFSAIQESRLLGLTVETTGELAVVGRLDRERSSALGLAVKQCLVNVLKHSGTTHAEVAVYGSGSEVSVLVVDSGKGFAEAEISADRLGLRHSVRKRIETVGGEVAVWSTVGRGTSVMIRVPFAEAHGDTMRVAGAGTTR